MGKAIGQNPMKRLQVVNGFAMKNALPKKVLIHVGDSFGVKVRALRVGKERSEIRCHRAGQCGADTGLNDGIAAENCTPVSTQAGTVERMSQGFNETSGGVVGQLSVGIQSDNETNVAQ